VLSKTVLIDTSVWLFALRKEYLPKIKDQVDHHLKTNLVFITGIIKLEILSGARTKPEYQRLHNRLNTLENIQTDDAIWDKAYELGFNLRRKGITVPHTDILIAACALSKGCTLVHADNHFDLIAQHVNLNIESHVKEVSKSFS
jgi:predicted nucleic acid-binding protein